MRESWLEGIRVFTPDDDDDQPSPQHIAALRASILLIPEFHFHLVRQVELRGSRQHPHTGGGNDANTHIIYLSRACLSRNYNDPYNITFLHELGHLVDHAFGVTSYLRGLRSPSAEAFLSTEHSHRDGGTDGPGERVADCYMYYLATQVGDSRTTNANYRGAAGEMRFNLLLSSPAFTGHSGARRT